MAADYSKKQEILVRPLVLEGPPLLLLYRPRERRTFASKAAAKRREPVFVAPLAGSSSHGRGFLFKSSRREDRVLGQSEAHRLNLRYARKAGLPAIKLHEFRHSCATCLLANGVSPRYVSRWLGHSSEETTLKYYSHLLPDEETVVSDFWNAREERGR